MGLLKITVFRFKKMAVTSSLVNNVCYPSVAAANDAYFSSIPVALVAGQTSYETRYLQIAGAWNVQQTSIDKFGNISIVYTKPVVAPAFPGCDYSEPFFDGMAMGWGVVGAMAAALSVIFVRKAFFR